jgi:hypothetical protein
MAIKQIPFKSGIADTLLLLNSLDSNSHLMIGQNYSLYFHYLSDQGQASIIQTAASTKYRKISCPRR